MEGARQLLAADPKLASAKGPDGSQPLHLAARLGHAGLAQVLLDHKARPDAKNARKQTPLYCAIEEGHGEVARLLLKVGASLQALQQPKVSPLHGWLETGREAAAALMVEFGADTNHVLQSYGRRTTPLHALAESEHTSLRPEARLRLTRLLLDHGADPNARDESGKTPLHAAAEYGHWQMLELLLDAGADLQAGDQEQGTALHYAVGSADVFAVELLLRRGADPLSPASDGKTPLDYARDFFGFRYIEDAIAAAAGVPREAEGRARPGEFLCACKKGYLDLARRILQESPGVIHTRGSVGLIDTASPLHLAAVYGQPEIARLLLAHGHPADAVDQWGTTPLMDAVKYGHPEVVRILLEGGAQVNARDAHQSTALHEAAYPRADAAELVRLLLQAGADPGARDDDGRTPLQEAERHVGHPMFQEHEDELQRAIELLRGAKGTAPG